MILWTGGTIVGRYGGDWDIGLTEWGYVDPGGLYMCSGEATNQASRQVSYACLVLRDGVCGTAVVMVLHDDVSAGPEDFLFLLFCSSEECMYGCVVYFG